jgi:hypothetical protein
VFSFEKIFESLLSLYSDNFANVMYCFLFVAVCGLDGLTNQILFCVLSFFAASQPDDYVAAKPTTSGIPRRTARFIQQLSNLFLTFSVYVFLLIA